jgi:hypothetical protein
MAKGGGFITNMFSAGLGAYAAKNSSSVQSLLMTLVKYAAVIIGIGIAVYAIAGVLQRVREGFSVPVAPSKSGDEKMVTPAGNVIIY